MTFFARPVAPFKVDFLKLDYTGTMTDDPIYNISGSLVNTRATLANDQFTLYSGSHWRIEASQSILGNGDGAYRSDIYYMSIFSVTNQQNVGFSGVLSESVPPTSTNSDPNPDTDNTGYLIRGRATSCALILSSDINNSEVYRIQVIAPNGSLAVQSGSTKTRMQHGSILKIIEFPA